MYNNFLIRLIEINTEKMLAAFYTEKSDMFLKTYYFCKEKEIELNINQYNKTPYLIKNIIVNFGDDKYYSSIDVYVE